MCKIIDDFERSGDIGQGVGFWESNTKAVVFAQTITRSQRKKLRRWGIIPHPFFLFLESINAIPKIPYVPERQRTVSLLLDLLWLTPQRNGSSASEGEILRIELLKELALLPSGSTASAQQTYIRLDLYGSIPSLYRTTKKKRA
jgi:hypothetical protein